MDDRTRQALRDLCGFGEQGARLAAQGKQAWDADEFLRLAGEAVVHRIGEAVARVENTDPELLEAHPEIRWRPMRGTRNIVAHGYPAIDHEILWNALAHQLPREIDGIRRILAEDPGD